MAAADRGNQVNRNMRNPVIGRNVFLLGRMFLLGLGYLLIGLALIAIVVGYWAVAAWVMGKM